MNKTTQIILSVAGVLVIITCVVLLLRKPSNPNIEFIREWEKAKQEAVETHVNNTSEKEPEYDDGKRFTN